MLRRTESDFQSEAHRRSVTLLEEIVGLKVTESPDVRRHGSEFAELPSGAVVEVRGEGFNERTLRVHWNHADYLVFVSDLGLA